MEGDDDPGSAPTAAVESAETAAPSWWDDSAERPPAGPRIEPAEVSPAHYELLGEHGRGGLGRVLRARDRRTGRVVAIKEILRDSPMAVRRFRREALVTANLQHPAIVPVYEVGRWPDGQPFYAMKLVDGVPLSAAIRDAVDATARLAILPHVIQVADALAYAHGQGWIHRDLKPANVLVGAFGETVVIDWGLAKRIREVDESSADSLPLVDDGATVDGQVLGTPVYMPPEQARGDALDPRADVYAIGALLYHVLAGSPPYHDARNTADVIARVTAGPPRPLPELAPGLPPELYTIVARAMAHQASDRYPTAGELSADLARFRAGNLVAAHSYTTWQLGRRWLRRHRTAVAVAGLAALALAVVGVVSFRENLAARRRAEAERGRATAAQAAAEARLGALHTELGFRELTAGKPTRALPYLADAYRRAPDAIVTRLLLGRALASVETLELALAAPGLVSGFSFGGGRVVAAGATATAVIDLAARQRRADLPGLDGVVAPDGATVAARSVDGATLLLLDVATGAERARRPLGNGRVTSWVGFDRAGRLVAVTGEGAVAAHDDALAPVGSAQVPFAPGHVAIAASGRVLVGGAAGRVWTWDPASGEIVDQPGAHAGDVTRLCASADGATWLTMDGASTRVWRGRTSVAQVAHAGRAATCEVDAAGDAAVTVVDGLPIMYWDLTAAVPAPRELADPADVAAISPDGRMIAVGGAHGELELMDATGASLARWVGHDDPVAVMAFSPDGRRVISATAGGDLRIWRTTVSQGLITIEAGERGWGGAFLPGDRAVVAGADRVRIVAAADGRRLAELTGHRDEVVFAVASADGTRIATASRDHTARLWTGDGAPVAELTHADRVRRVELSGDGARLLTACKDGTFGIWRTRDGARERLVTAPGSVFTARISRDGTRVVTVVEGAPVVTLWDADSGQQLADLPVQTDQPIDAGFSPDGALVAIASGGPVAPVYDGRTGTPRFDVVHEAHVFAAVWSEDGALLATGDLSGAIRLTRRDGTRVRALRVDSPVSLIAFRPDGRVLAVGTVDSVRLIETAGGRELARLDLGPTNVVHLEFTRDGRQLLIGRFGPGVRLWQVPEWTGSADALDRRVRCAAPFRLDPDGLAAATLDEAACR